MPERARISTVRIGLAAPEQIRRREHIELACPVPHPWMMAGPRAPLALLLGCRARELEQMLRETGAPAVEAALAAIDLDALIDGHTDCAGRTQPGLRELVADEQRRAGRVRPTRTWCRLELAEGLRRAGLRPDWLMLRALPVLSDRPDLDACYAAIVEANARLRQIQTERQAESALRTAERSLHDAVAELFAALTGGLTRHVEPVDRAVAVPDPELGLDQCGLPRAMALRLFEAHVAGRLRAWGDAADPAEASRLVRRGGARVLDALDEVIADQMLLLSSMRLNGQPVVRAFEVVLTDGERDTIVRVNPLVAALLEVDRLEASDDGVPETGGDGCEVAVRPILSAAARRDARDWLLPMSTLLNPANGEPLVARTGDVTLGCLYLTTERFVPGTTPRRFGSWEDAIRTYELGTVLPDAAIGLQERIEVRMRSDAEIQLREYDPTEDWVERYDQGARWGEVEMVPTTVGRIILFNAINETLADQSARPVPFVNTPLDRERFSELVQHLIREYANRVAGAALETIARVGLQYATQSGLSLGIDDFASPPDKQKLLDEADAEVADVEQQFRRGLITREELSHETARVWTYTIDAVARAVDLALDRDGPLMMLAQASTWTRQTTGYWLPRRLMGIYGFVVDRFGLIDRPIRSTFGEGLSPLDLFLTGHAVRKGRFHDQRVDGLARDLLGRLVAAMHGVTVTETDCGTEEGIWVEELTNPTWGKRHLNRLLGRYLAAEVQDPSTGQVLVPLSQEYGTVVTDFYELPTIAEAKVPRVRVRSPLTCESRQDVCQRCYGWDPSRRRVVESGTAVGLMAARALAADAHLLSERPFRYGIGPTREQQIEQYWSPADSDERSYPVWRRPSRFSPPVGISRVSAFLEAQRPPDAAILADLDGTVEIQQRDDDRILTLRSTEIYRDQYVLDPGDRLSVSQGEQVAVGQVLGERADGQPIVTQLAGTVNVHEPSATKSGQREIAVTAVEEEVREYALARHEYQMVANGETVWAGTLLTYGDKDPAEILRIQGREAVAQYLVGEIDESFWSSGLALDSRHVELIVRQMLRYVRIDTAGDTPFLPGELVDRLDRDDTNRRICWPEGEWTGAEPATAQPVLLGISEIAAHSDGFLARTLAAEDPGEVARRAALAGTVDPLLGPHEQAIVGNVPTGWRAFPPEPPTPLESTADGNIFLSQPSFDDDDGISLADLILGDDWDEPDSTDQADRPDSQTAD